MFLRGDVLVHRADIVEFDWLLRMSRAFLLCCGNDGHRVHLGAGKKQCGHEEPHDQKFSEVHLTLVPSVFLPTYLRREQEERLDSA